MSSLGRRVVAFIVFKLKTFMTSGEECYADHSLARPSTLLAGHGDVLAIVLARARADESDVLLFGEAHALSRVLLRRFSGEGRHLQRAGVERAGVEGRITGRGRQRRWQNCRPRCGSGRGSARDDERGDDGSGGLNSSDGDGKRQLRPCGANGVHFDLGLA
jgi:hypothetical protein